MSDKYGVERKMIKFTAKIERPIRYSNNEWDKFIIEFQALLDKYELEGSID